MNQLPCPKGSRAVLVGASTFQRLEGLPAVQANVPALRSLLTGPSGPFLTGNCSSLVDPASTREVSAAFRQAAKEATDTLLIYYAGHGLLDETGELYLAVPDSDHTSVYDTSLPYDWIRRAVRTTGAGRRIVILDCCYSARAFGPQSESFMDVAEVDGTYVMAAAGETAVALAPPGETYTAFTAELLATLRDGVPGAAELLDLNVIFRHLQGQLKTKRRPVPLDLDRNGLGTTPFIRNNAYVPAVLPDHGGHDMLHLLESTPRTATVAQLVSSVGMLHEQRSATATDLVRTALQVRAIAELAPLLSALYAAGFQAPAESALPAMLLARPVKESAQLVDLLHMASADECVVSLLRLSARLHPAHDATAFASELDRAGLPEHALAILSSFAITREIEETVTLIRLICRRESGGALETVMRSVATRRPVTDVTQLFPYLAPENLSRARDLLCRSAAEHRNAAETAALISAFGQAGHTQIARRMVEIGLTVRGPQYMAELVAALQSARLFQEAADARVIAVQTWLVQDISQFIAHLLAVGQQHHALAAAVNTAHMRSIGDFGAIAEQLTSLNADLEVKALLDHAARTCQPDEASYLLTRLDAVGNSNAAERIFWLSLSRPLGHAAKTLQHLVQEQSRFLTDRGIHTLCRSQHPHAIAKLAIALERVLPDKTNLLLDVTDRPVHHVAALIDSLEKGISNTLSNRVLTAVAEKWGHQEQAQLVIALEERSQVGCAEYLTQQITHSKVFTETLRAMRTKPSQPEPWWPWWPSNRSNYEPSQYTHTAYRVSSADETVHSIARRYGVRDAGIIEENNLQWPYELSQGQCLSIPLQSGSSRFMVPRFPRKLGPQRIHPDVRVLQGLLKTAGYMAEDVPESDNYGPLTCQAVTRFNVDHLLSDNNNPADDRRITQKGWDILHRIQRAQRVQ
ncbi:caspase family protein [Streptomyces sp. GbtcB7]|uniref:caspase, EACC1-associated type n=1 Tax=Streptomyces sp. GbtcB7 TaxID=2824752 RepID=UPI001C2F9A47|nr:caspase family protein [Streptomyces sp. GbtcB7]